MSLVSSLVVVKILNFASNVVITRMVGHHLGTGSLRLNDLLFLAPQVLTYEGLRRTTYRSNTSNKTIQQSLINLSWLAAPVAVLFTLVFASCMYIWPPVGTIRTNEYHRAILYTVFAIIIAVITEPAFALAQGQLKITLRANIEMISVVAKCATMLYLTVYSNQTVEAFAISNLIYMFVTLCCYWSYFLFNRHSATIPLPKQLQNGKWCTSDIQTIASVFWRQSLQKWLLENGEKMALAFLGNTSQQGVYVIVERLGSIVVRLLFQPIEEMTISTLGKLTRNNTTKTRDIHYIFSGWLLLLTLVGLTFASIGPAYVHILLHVLYGDIICSSVSFTLGWYCVYVLFMAINGILEAFVQGTSSPSDISRYNRWMLLFTIVYMSSVLSLLPLFGATGLIMANIIKMLCRIGVCGKYYIRPYFVSLKEFRLISLLPHIHVIGMFVISTVLTQCSLLYIVGGVRNNILYTCIHISIGIVCLVATNYVIWKSHGTHLKHLLMSEKKD